jgi:hypothetical protein
MHEGAVPAPRVGGAAAASEGAPTIGRSAWRRPSRNGAARPARNRYPAVSARHPVTVKPC